MIKEILLSLTVAAFSGVSSFVGSPKRVISDSHEPYGDYSFTFNYSSHNDELTATIETPFGDLYEAQLDLNQWYQFYIPSGSDKLEVQFTLYDDNTASVSLYWYFASLTIATNFYNNAIANFSFDDTSPANVEETILDDTDNYAEIAFDIPQWQTDLIFWFTLTEPPTYTVTKELYNCSINSMPQLPDTYQSSSVGQTFVIYGAANSDLVGDYGFTSSSLSVSGASATALSLSNEIGNSGYFRACSFSVNLPANSFTISLTAYRPSFSITSTLNNCTVSPSIPSSYSGMYAEDFTFTAEQGFYFNKNVTQWEFTGGVVAQDPEYSGLVWGTLYESVKIRLVFDAGNANIRVSGVSYTIDSYQQGWRDGDKAGYDRGHADGLVAGDSYGVWNWLKQAARTTGEFLSIPLLPGFSLGGLLTALAGLVIIWFFIKGFLFKS